MTNHNRNWKRTHKRIVQTVFDLWADKPISKITVNEVCQIVGINRSTFYGHFDSVYAVSNETGAEVYKVLYDFFRHKTGQFFMAGSIQTAAIQFLELIKQSQSFYRIYFAHMNILPFSHDDPMRQQLYQAFVIPYGHLHPEFSDVQLDYMLSAFEASMAMILRQWTQGDFAEPELSIAKVIMAQPLLEPCMQQVE